MEQRAQRKKRARRDFEDEDYEEPAQPRRVSARRQAAAEAQAQARKGMLRSQPSDKRKLGQKGMQRIDSMQFGGVRTSCWSSLPATLVAACTAYDVSRPMQCSFLGMLQAHLEHPECLKSHVEAFFRVRMCVNSHLCTLTVLYPCSCGEAAAWRALGRACPGQRQRTGSCAPLCTNLAATGSWWRMCCLPPALCRASTAAPPPADTGSEISL